MAPPGRNTAQHGRGRVDAAPPARCGSTLQIGTAYFGCRDKAGRFDIAKLKDTVAANPVRAIEIKLSQGAKPGLGGLLPGAKVTPEIAGSVVSRRARIVRARLGTPNSTVPIHCWTGWRCSPTRRGTRRNQIGRRKSRLLCELVDLMSMTDRGVDFITVDGGEGGTGAAPLIFSESVALPFRLGFARVYELFARAGSPTGWCSSGQESSACPTTRWSPSHLVATW